MSVNTKTAPRRELHFDSMQQVLDDAESVTSQPHETTGNWSSGQIITHVGELIDVSLHGTDAKMPLPLRVMGRLLRPWLLSRPIKPGLTIPKAMRPKFTPPPDVPLDQAMERFRVLCKQANEPGTMTHRSPLLGPMSHDDWVKMHCRHAELHFSFIQPK